MEINSNKIHVGRPLIVDLDGSLLNTDMLVESANNLIVRHPFKLIRLLRGLKHGKSHLKAQLADACEIDAATLPYNNHAVALLKKQKASGRKIVLATASHRVLAEAVAKHLGLFDEVLATEGNVNLKSEVKRDVLVAKFGEQGFDYIGNTRADLPIWKSACRAYVVSSSSKLIEEVRGMGNLEAVIPNDRPSMIKALMKAMRPHQWIKNLLLFIPPLAAHQVGNLTALIDSTISFIVFCLAASSIYLFNDLIDVSDDRHHPRKRLRPFAAGDISLLYGWLLWPILLVMAISIALYWLSSFFCVILVTYFVVTIIYSLRLKQIAILDAISLASLYSLRLIAGAVAIDTSITFWLLAFSMFLFLSLAFIKRFSELKLARQAGRDFQIKGRGYVHQDLEMISSMGVASGYLAVLVLALYIQDPNTIVLYPSHHFIWLACPLLLYWISRAWLIADRGQMHDDPIIFAIKDRISWVVGVCFISVFCLATTGPLI